MAHETTFKCDKCNETWSLVDDPKRQRWALQLKAGCLGNGSLYPTSTPSDHGGKVELCRPCMVLLGLVPSSKVGIPDPPTPEPKPTALEIIEMLAECLRE